MFEMPAHEYKGYTVVINARNLGERGWTVGFSIHDGHIGGALGLAKLPVVHQTNLLGTDVFPTKEKAQESATVDAHTWIDSQQEAG